MASPPPPPAASQLRSVNCTKCAAPITLHGGHRVLTITCAYCGSELDAKDEFKLLHQFTNRDRPPTPIELGMSGTFKGVEFTVIALVQYRSSDGYGWLEFALFSPTHGYAWLEQVDNHFVFSRRTRDLPNTPISPQVKTRFKVRDRTYRVFDSFRASILYVEGELTFVAKRGDQVDITEGIAPPFIYARERTEDEEEYVLGEYIEPEEVYATLGLKNEPGKRRTVHAAQPYAPSALTTGIATAGKIFTPLALVLLVAAIVLGWGSTLLVSRFDPNVFRGGMQSEPFKVAHPDKLLQLNMHAPLNNAWAAYDIQVHQADKPIFSMAKQISYYSGYDGGESWSEGSQSASAYFKVPAAGEYKLVVRGEGGTGSSGRTPPKANLTVTLEEGIIVSRYYWMLLIASVFAWLWGWFARLRFESKRWSDTDDD